VSEERRRRIEIPEEVARAEAVPDDLDSSLVGPYTFPTLVRRRRGAIVLAAGAAAAGAGAMVLARGLVITAAALALLAAWHLASAWPLRIDDGDALDTANRETEFAVGHASGAVGFDGVRARPVWNVLVFSADEPPSRRGLVRIDAVDGSVVETYVEDSPALGP
jgi:hypothetical protein